MTTLSQANYLLKSVYLNNDQIEQFAQDTILWQLFKKDNRWVQKVGAGQGSGTPAAYGMVWPIEDTYNTSVGMFSLSSPSLIPPGSRTGAQAFVNLGASSAGVLFDAILFDAAKSSDQAFENVVQRNMNTIFTDFKKFESRVMWGDGSGQLGVVSAINSLVITLDTTWSGRPFPVTKFLRPNQYVTFLSSAYAADSGQNGVQITATDDVNGTITLASVTNINVGDLIFNYQSHTASVTAGNEPIGLRGIFGNNSTLFNINPATNSLWTPAQIVTGNTDPSEDFLEQLKAYIGVYGATPQTIVTHPLVVSKYGSQLKTYKRVMGNAENYAAAGGVKTSNNYQKLEGPEFVGVGPLIPDSNTPMGTGNSFHLWMGDVNSTFIGEAGDMQWMEEDGKILKFLIGSATVASPSMAQYVAYLQHFWQIGCYRRRSGALATNVNYLQAAS